MRARRRGRSTSPSPAPRSSRARSPADARRQHRLHRAPRLLQRRAPTSSATRSPSCSTTARTSIVFDLRDNPGGYIDAAQKIASEFIESGLIFTQESSGDGVKRLGGDRRRAGDRPEDRRGGPRQRRLGLRVRDRGCGPQGARPGDDHRRADLSARTPCRSGISWTTAAASGSPSRAGSPRITTAWRPTACSRTSRSRPGRNAAGPGPGPGRGAAVPDRSRPGRGWQPAQRPRPPAGRPIPTASPVCRASGQAVGVEPAIARVANGLLASGPTKGGGVQ